MLRSPRATPKPTRRGDAGQRSGSLSRGFKVGLPVGVETGARKKEKKKERLVLKEQQIRLNPVAPSYSETVHPSCVYSNLFFYLIARPALLCYYFAVLFHWSRSFLVTRLLTSSSVEGNFFWRQIRYNSVQK